jgi:exosortase
MMIGFLRRPVLARQPNGVMNQLQMHLLFGAYSLGLLALNASVLDALIELSRRDATASHLILVPFVSAALMWLKRESIFRSVRSYGPFEISVFVVAVALSWAGYTFLAPHSGLDALSTSVSVLVVLWVSGFLLFYGHAAFRAALFPLLFLAFMVPIPSAVLVWATQFLKSGSAEVVDLLFAVSGTPVHRNGFVFELPKFAIEIADECSGIRSSIGLMLTTLLAGDMLLRTGWKKALLVTLILPLVVLKNGIRIVTLSLLGTYVDTSFITGKLHHEGGMVFYFIALAILAPIVFLLYNSERGLPDVSSLKATRS